MAVLLAVSFGSAERLHGRRRGSGRASDRRSSAGMRAQGRVLVHGERHVQDQRLVSRLKHA
jgi:hypothetical protein